MKILSVELERIWTYLRRTKYEDIVSWNKKELEHTYEKQNMKILSAELKRTWTYIWKTKYEDNLSWTRKNLNLPTRNKIWINCQLNLPFIISCAKHHLGMVRVWVICFNNKFASIKPHFLYLWPRVFTHRISDWTSLLEIIRWERESYMKIILI